MPEYWKCVQLGTELMTDERCIQRQNGVDPELEGFPKKLEVCKGCAQGEKVRVRHMIQKTEKQVPEPPQKRTPKCKVPGKKEARLPKPSNDVAKPAKEEVVEGIKEKVCGTCGALKPLEDFPLSTLGEDKRQNTCKECKGKSMRAGIARKKANSKAVIMDLSSHTELFEALERAADEDMRDIGQESAWIIKECLRERGLLEGAV